MRIKYKRAKTVFNGKYYFGFKNDEYKELFGKNRKKFQNKELSGKTLA